MITYAYERVSSKDQNLDRQDAAIKQFRPDIKEDNIFKDKITGKTFERRLLTKEIATELKELRVDDIYIPIDGLEKDYVRLKNCKKEDYRAVLKNIKDCENITNIHVLVNITESNKNGIKELIRIIRDEYKIQASVRFNRVMSKSDMIDIKEYYEMVQWLDKGKPKTIDRCAGCEALCDHYVMPISQIKRALMILKKPFYSKFTQSEMTNGICHKPAKTLVNMPLCGVIIPPLIEKGGIF